MILRQAAFQGKEPMLWGNLHCHTTVSDGQCTPATAVRQYAAAGYDFLAITDHNIYNFENPAPETGLLILPGTEIGRLLGYFNVKGHPVLHVVAVGPEQGNGFTHAQPLPYATQGTADQCQDVLDDAINANNLAVLCHPEWSGNTVEELMALEGYSMIEVWNTGSAIGFNCNENAYHWDALLDRGRRIYGVASDDGHAPSEHCHSRVVVRAEKNVESILKALRTGAFYASTGPEIYDFYVEDGVAVVHCSPAREIAFRSFRSPHRTTRGENLTGAQAKVREATAYIRAEVIDHNGRRAWTNPIFFD